jgi:RNA polymerase sigma factor (sigma-70 family)
MMQKIIDSIEVSSDQLVIEKILKGDSALFEVLIRRYNPVLYKIARSYGFNHQDAEDLMQDTHVAAYSALSKFESRSTYKTWISRIMINKCIYKTKYGYLRHEVSAEISESQHQPIYMQLKENQTENLLWNRELTMLLERSLQNIPAIYSTVFVLREVEGFSIAETAELLNITPMNVKVRLNRAKALLQKQIEKVYAHSDLYAFNLVYCTAIVEKVFERINSQETRSTD